MKKYLIPHEGQYFKSNLHCHSVFSDGRWTPEEIKKNYMAQGYSVIAYTDHNVFIAHDELADADFLPLHGVEYDVSGPDPIKDYTTCHFCMIALEPDNMVQPCWHRSEYVWGAALDHRDTVLFDESQPDYVREYTPECISEMMRIGREKGFFVTYNHPSWSMETALEYNNYHNMHAMEIVNFGCINAGYNDYNDAAYDDMLRAGKRIYCIATDDNHNGYPVDSRDNDSFGGFTMIKADRLDYRTVTRALEAGHFYASEGPIIHDLWMEDSTVHITFDPADRVLLNTGRRRAAIRFAENGPLTEASFDVVPEDVYFRLTVIDARGRHADTNAYFTDEVL